MNRMPLTDAQIGRALRAYLPEHAQPDLRERILESAATTRQQRTLPSFLGALTDADPVARRRSLLIAAALLIAVAAASIAAAGAWRVLQRDPFRELSLEPPTDLPAFVLSSYERLLELPPVAFTWRSSDPAKGRVYVDGSGAVRFDRFTSAEATEPSGYRILSSNHTISGIAHVESEDVWVEPGHEAIDVPREHLRGILSVATAPGCELAKDQVEVGNGTAAMGWRYVGVEYVAGRPTHHVACVGELSLDIDLWLDIESRLILRTREPLTDDAGQSVPGQFGFTEVTEIAFGEQPAVLFEPPEGLARMSADAYGDYICARDLPNELMPGISDCPTAEADATPQPEPSATPTPTPTLPPSTSPCAVRPGETGEPPGPLAWTRASLERDWPAPVRTEPAGGGSVRPMPLTYLDPSGDAGSDAYPCVDLRGVMADTKELHLKLNSNQPVVDPADHWIAYGIVTDDDRDGVPDWRYGMDNDPGFGTEVQGDPASRWWRTDLHTGRTEAGGMDVPGSGGWLFADFKTEYPRSGSDAGFVFSGATETTTGSAGWGIELDMPFYAWASAIVNGRVVATDHAPDTGWLVATRDVWPGGTFLLRDPFPHLSMAVPQGWTRSSTDLGSTRIGVADVLKRVICGSLPRDFPGDEAPEADCARVRFEMIDNPQEPCQDTIVPNHASFDDFVAAVAGLPAITENEDVTVDGYRGKHLEFSPGEEDTFNCLSPDYQDVWILDVDGVLLMIVSKIGGDLPLDVSRKAVKAEIRHMVESIRFER
jgi:hypothetical protein